MKATHTNYHHPRHLRVEENNDVYCMSPSCSDYGRLAKASLPSFGSNPSDYALPVSSSIRKPDYEMRKKSITMLCATQLQDYSMMDENTKVLVPFPEDFPTKGKYRTWDKHWNPTGYAGTPNYKGQPAERFPPDAQPIEARWGGYIMSVKQIKEAA